MRTKIYDYFANTYQGDNGQAIFQKFDDLHPRVEIEKNFDELLIPKDHVSRSQTDTFYYDDKEMLRTHTSAHQCTFLKQGNSAFLVTGDCYRRDEIDRSHYPVFHQMEGVRVWGPSENKSVDDVVADLKGALEGMVKSIFGDVEMRWVDAYFPFTDPSLELEVFYNGEWLEVLGSGVIEMEILRSSGKEDHIGWAFGIGLERLAMVLFDIPDIRLFWSQDERFTSQFTDGKITKFNPFSKYPPCTKDISLWGEKDALHENDLCDLFRQEAGDLVEQITCVDEFTHPKTKRLSRCYRVTYRSLERTLLNEEINEIHFRVRDIIGGISGVELR